MIMNSHQRVLATLRGDQPDRVPFCELAIDRSLARQLMGWDEVDQPAGMESMPYTVEEAKAVASFLKIDNISYIMRAPVYCEKGLGKDGRAFYGRGLLKTKADLAHATYHHRQQESLKRSEAGDLSRDNRRQPGRRSTHTRM